MSNISSSLSELRTEKCPWIWEDVGPWGLYAEHFGKSYGDGSLLK